MLNRRSFVKSLGVITIVPWLPPPAQIPHEKGGTYVCFHVSEFPGHLPLEGTGLFERNGHYEIHGAQRRLMEYHHIGYVSAVTKDWVEMFIRHGAPPMKSLTYTYEAA